MDEVQEQNTERMITPVSPELVREIDDYRFASRFTTRAAAVRRLLRIGLETVRARQAAPSRRKSPAAVPAEAAD